MKRIAILIPCYNESELIADFNKLLLSCINDLPFLFDIIYVNDGSLDKTAQIIHDLKCTSKNVNISLLNLYFNVGHQLAIYQGLLYVNDLFYDNVLIMDSDGEDDPNAIREILKYADSDVVQVIRGKRSESFLFKLFYSCYKFIFLFLIGKKIDYGNFSLIKPNLVAAAVDKSFVHLGAFLDNQKCTKSRVKCNRMKRLDGNSKMSFKNLFYHGISSLTENAQHLLFLFIRLSILILLGILILIGIIIYKKYIVSIAILGWSSTLLANLVNSLLICIGFFVIGSLQLNVLSKQGGQIKNKTFHLYRIIRNWNND